MGITRTPLPFERDFVQVPNAWLRDEKLSRRARGLLAELMTHRAGWHITIASLQRTGPEGRDAIRSAVQELVGRGYLVRRQTQGESGRFNEIEYLLTDPSTADGFSDTGGFAVVGSPDDGSADVGEPAPKNTRTKKTIQLEDQEEGVRPAPSPSCRRHSGWSHDDPCKACRRDREAHEAWEKTLGLAWDLAMAELDSPPVPIRGTTMSERVEDCTEEGSAHRWLTDRTCMRCEQRRPQHDRGAA